MRFLIIEHFRLAQESFRSAKLRTLLTTLGIAIGIACITTVLSFSGGVLAVLKSQTGTTEGSLIVVRPGPKTDLSLDTATNPIAASQFSVSTLSEDDVAAIKNLPNVRAVAPFMTITGDLRQDDTTIANGTVVATQPDLVEFNGFTLKDGAFIESNTSLNTATVGAQLAIDLFGTSSPIGQTFTFKGHRFAVTGILERTDAPITINGFDTDRSAYISIAQGKKFLQGAVQLQQINVLATAESDTESLVEHIYSAITAQHFDDDDFHVLYGRDIAHANSTLFYSMAVVLLVVASVSLVVGGIGIMNIMLVNVAERTREIGLRKAVGASNGNIVMQFLVESLCLSLIGGAIGLGLGYFFAFAVTLFLAFEPAYTWTISSIALGVAVGVGVIFGLYPAARAARKDPIESLRLYR